MKYKFTYENDEVTLKYKDKSFTFKINVKTISELQGLVMKSRKKMVQELAKEGTSMKDLTIEYKENGKTYYDNSNKLELEKIYQEEVTLEYFDKKCQEIFGMDFASLITDVGLETEEEGAKFSTELLNYFCGNIPR